METIIWVLSKAIWMLVDLNNSLLVLLVLGTVLLFTDRRNLGRRLITIASTIILILSVLQFDQIMLLPLENRFPIPDPLPKSVEGIIVLGGAENARISHARDQVVLLDAAERLTTFVGLSRLYPAAKLVFAGGAGALNEQSFKGADTARKLFEQLGLHSSRVQFESNSRNTFENAKNAFELVKPKKGERWILITSAWHMPRAVGVFRKIGWPVIPYPVDFATSGKMEYGLDFYGLSATFSATQVLREWVGIVAYWYMGRTSALFPGPD